MGYRTERIIIDEKGNKFTVGDVVTIHHPSGGGAGGCEITKITDKGFRYCQGTGKEKSVTYENLKSIER